MCLAIVMIYLLLGILLVDNMFGIPSIPFLLQLLSLRSA